jgi:hypothetical protein
MIRSSGWFHVAIIAVVLVGCKAEPAHWADGTPVTDEQRGHANGSEVGRRAPDPQPDVEAENLIAQLIRAKIITNMSTNNNEVQVNRRAWEAMNLNAKKGLTMTCARYFAGRGESVLVKVVDNRSGKTLATNSAFGGVEIHGD